LRVSEDARVARARERDAVVKRMLCD
jgi:hypothetical protein